MNNLANMMKQAQAMKENMERAKRELAELEIRGEAGGGLVRVTMSGRHDVRRVEIDPALMHDDREVLEDLIAAACNDAVCKVTRAAEEKMGGVAAGLGAGLDLSAFKLPL